VPTKLWKDVETMQGLFGNLKMGFYVINVQGEFLDATPEFLDFFGLTSVKELRSRNAKELLQLEPFALSLDLLHTDRLVRQFHVPVQSSLSRDRWMVDLICRRMAQQSGELQFYGVLIEVGDCMHLPKDKAEDPEEEQNFRDPLTGAFNRSYLERFERYAFEHRKIWGCIYIYIDHFRQYCERYGVEAGIDVVQKMARFLMRHSRSSDAIVRTGDGEFMILLDEVAPSMMGKISKRIRTAALGQAPIPFSLGYAMRQGNEPLDQTIVMTSRDLAPVQVLHRTPKMQRSGSYLLRKK
jgi:diguanylate cyclase (GGDEF)-like protein